jgi:DNA end-binding protein Ku
MTKKFDISAYHDEYQKRLKEAIEAKIRGQEIVNADTSKPNNVIDLMDALKKTVEMAQTKEHVGTA